MHQNLVHAVRSEGLRHTGGRSRSLYERARNGTGLITRYVTDWTRVLITAVIVASAVLAASALFIIGKKLAFRIFYVHMNDS